MISDLKIVNFLVFQWFFIRLTKVVDINTARVVGWKVIGPILPLAGWWNDYIYLNKKDKISKI